MKKILFAIAIVLTLGLTASAQRKTDGFFDYYDLDNSRTTDDPASVLPGLPGLTLDPVANQDAPIGTGLLILTALGAGYAVARKKK